MKEKWNLILLFYSTKNVWRKSIFPKPAVVAGWCRATTQCSNTKKAQKARVVIIRWSKKINFFWQSFFIKKLPIAKYKFISYKKVYYLVTKGLNLTPHTPFFKQSNYWLNYWHVSIDIRIQTTWHCCFSTNWMAVNLMAINLMPHNWMADG